MVKSRFKGVLIFGMFLCFYGIGCEDTSNPSTDKTLREIVEENYISESIFIGGTTGSWAFGTPIGELLDKEFSYVTPENDYKHQHIRNNSEGWDWEEADLWEQHILDHHQILRMHCPIGPQCSTWAMEDNRTGEELEQELILFMQAVCERYNGKPNYLYMDVVNETVVKGEWNEDKAGTDAWECPWIKIGQDTDAFATPLYISLAFQIASQYAPDIKLIYNHHEAPSEKASWDLIKATITYLRNKGLRVDGIGWQAHVEVGVEQDGNNAQYLNELIGWAHQNQLEFHITEASVWLKNGRTNAQLQAQAETYKAILEMLLEMRSGGVVAWNTWHISDYYTWHSEWFPSLFDESFKPKPAYFGINEVLSFHTDY